MAIHTLLNELGQQVEIIKKTDVQNYNSIQPTGAVPCLDDNGTILKEGASIAIYLMEKHKSELLPTELKARANALNWLMFANATIHPAYSKMFFILKGLDKSIQEQAFKPAVESLNKYWKIADDQLAKTKYVCGDKLSMADLFLAVYANWNGYFPVPVTLGDNVKRLLRDVSARPSFQKAVKAEQVEYKAAA